MRIENDSIASELKIILLYRDDARNDGAVARIASILNLSRRTVYDYLDGRIKISLSFLHAAIIATDGDPDIKKFLEPDGWELVPKGAVAPDKATLAEECLDDVPALAAFHGALNDPESTLQEIKRTQTDLLREIRENVVTWMSTKRKGVVC